MRDRRGREESATAPAGGRRVALAASGLGLAAALAAGIAYLGAEPPLPRGLLLTAAVVLAVAASLASGAAVVLAQRRRPTADERPETGLPMARFLVIGPLLLLGWGAGMLPTAHGVAPAMAAGEFAALAFAANAVCDWIVLARLR
ncbi:MAG: hypothetical protein AB7N54_13070 [Alphaproteobacteria bacterium]